MNDISDINTILVVRFRPSWTFIWLMIWNGLIGKDIGLKFPLGALMTEEQWRLDDNA